MFIAAGLVAAAFAQPRPPPEPLTSDTLVGILTFRAEHLEVRQIETILPGRITFVRSGWGYGPRPWRGYRWGTTDVIATPPERMEGWTVYQGPRRLSVPEYLDAVGRDVDAAALERRVRRNNTSAGLLNGLALIGLGVGAAGLVGTVVDGPDDPWVGLSLGGFGGALLSGVVGGATSGRADRLAGSYEVTQDLDAVQQQVRDHNEALRETLGLTPQQAYRELDGPWRTGRAPRSR